MFVLTRSLINLQLLKSSKFYKAIPLTLDFFSAGTREMILTANDQYLKLFQKISPRQKVLIKLCKCCVVFFKYPHVIVQ